MFRFKFQYFFLIFFLATVVYHLSWFVDLKFGEVPGPVDPFLKTLQGYSLFKSGFQDQSLYYQFKDIDPNYEFCFFQKEIFTFRKGDVLFGSFPVAFSVLIALSLKLFSFSSLVYLFITLNFALYILIYRIIPKYISIFFIISWGLPFSVPNSEVSEHSLLIFLQILSLSILFRNSIKKKIGSNGNYFLSGVLLSSGIFFRHEVFIYLIFLFLTILYLKHFESKKFRASYKNLLFLGLGVFVTICIFLTMNYFMYDSLLGPRLIANSKGIFNFSWEKLEYYRIMLWKDPPYYGLFGYSPIFILTIIFTCIFYKHWNAWDKIMFFPIMGMITLVPVLAPNDGGSPWGARYLFLTVFPLIFLSARLIKWIKVNWNKYLYYVVQFVFILAVFQSILIERKGLKSFGEVSKMQEIYKYETALPQEDLIVITNELLAMQIGMNYFLYPMVLLSGEDKFASFTKKFLKTGKFKNIAVVEPKTSHLDLTKFSLPDKIGIYPEKILALFDQNLAKISIEEKSLIKLHRYRVK